MITLRRSTLALLAVGAAALILLIAIEFAFPVQMNKSKLVDFDVFRLVGTMISEGNLAGAYDVEVFHERQKTLVGYVNGTLIWSYPPPFSLVVSVMGLGPAWLAYVIFVVASLAAYLVVLRKVAGNEFHTTLVLFLGLFPMIIRTGQNSFLTGVLIGLTCLLALRRSTWAGAALGLMVIKPHLALGVGFWALLDRRWALACLAIGTALLACALATVVYGSDVWAWFFSGLAVTGDVLRDGGYPLFRMTSIFAFGLSLGLEPQLAMAAHLVIAALAVAALVAIRRSTASERVTIGAAVFVSALISPYNYDYDLAMLAFAAALLLEVVRRQASKLEKIGLFFAVWLVAFYWLILLAIMYAGLLSGTARPISIGGPVLIAVGVVMFKLVRRDCAVTR